MKVKIISAVSTDKLERGINDFIATLGAGLISIDFRAAAGAVYAMIRYDEKEAAA